MCQDFEMTNEAFATRLPADLINKLHDVCERFGLRKNFVVEHALREKLDDLIDAFELEEARKSAVSFTSWEDVLSHSTNVPEIYTRRVSNRS